MERNHNYNQNQNQQRFNHNYQGLPRSSMQQFQSPNSLFQNPTLGRNSLWINRNVPSNNDIMIGADLDNLVRNRMLNSLAIRRNLTERRDLLNPEQNQQPYDEIKEFLAAQFDPENSLRNRRRNVEIRENYLTERCDYVSKCAMTVEGCECLQRMLAAKDGCRLRETILATLTADLPILMVHGIGFLFVGAFFLSCNDHQMNRVLQSVVVGNELAFVYICNNYFGREAIKALIHNLKFEAQFLIITNILEHYIPFFTNYEHGQNVLQFFIYTSNRYFSRPLLRIFNAMANHCLTIATNELGCMILQCLIYPIFINIRLISSLLHAIVMNALVLANDRCGNYLIQHVIDANIEGVTRSIVGALMGRFCDLAKSEFGSNVVKKCLNKCEQSEVLRIVEEFMTDSSQLCSIAKDYFGKDVLVCSLQQLYTWGNIQHFYSLVRHINNNVSTLQSHIHGKEVIEKIYVLNRSSRFQFRQ